MQKGQSANGQKKKFPTWVTLKKGQISMDVEKIKSIQEWPQPCNVKDVQSFLGLANFYRRFIFKFSKIANLLTNLTKKVNFFVWGTDEEKVFKKLKL